MVKKHPKYPGVPCIMDGNSAAIHVEKEGSDAAGAFPITPSTQMGEMWEQAAADGHLNISGRPLIFIEPEGEHAAAAVTAGLSMSGLRSANFSSGQGIAYMHESLYAAVGKRLTYVLNMGCRAMTKATLNVHAGHDDYHAVDDTGFFQLFAKNVQQVADLNLIAHKIAELSLTPGIIAQDGFLTTHLMESLKAPERALVEEFLGRPDDLIDCPTGAQAMIYGKTRRRVPLLYDVDQPVLAGPVQNQESYMQSVAAQRPYFFAEIPRLAAQAFKEYEELTGRSYGPLECYKCEDADYLLIGQGSMIPNAEAVADFLREKRGLKVGVVNITMFRPFPGAELSRILQGKLGATVLERLDQPLAEDLPLIKEIRSAMYKGWENSQARSEIYPGYAMLDHAPKLYSASYGMGSRDLQPEGLIGAVENMIREDKHFYYLSIDFTRKPLNPTEEIHLQSLDAAYPDLERLTVKGSENPNLLPTGSLTLRIHSIGGWGGIATGKLLSQTLADILGYYCKANPKYGSEKKGQPTTFFLSVAPEAIRINCEYYYIDALLSPDPNLFAHTNPLGGLRGGGLLLWQSEGANPEAVWDSIPPRYQEEIRHKQIQLYALNGTAIAGEVAHEADLIHRMQGMAFQGAFLAAGPVMQMGKMDEATLWQKIAKQLEKKFGSKGKQMVEGNLTMIKRGFAEVMAIPYGSEQMKEGHGAFEIALPEQLKTWPQAMRPQADLGRFWQSTTSLYRAGQPGKLLADPFMAMSLMPLSSSMFRNLTEIRFEHPTWISDNCTGCGKCWTACPDSALPGLVLPVSEVLRSALDHLKTQGGDYRALSKAIRGMDGAIRKKLNAGLGWREAWNKVLKEETAQADATLQRELGELEQSLSAFEGALTKPYFSQLEKEGKLPGGLLQITVHPGNCKGCMECVAVCNDDALRPMAQNEESLEDLQWKWEQYERLPSTPWQYQRITDLEEGIGALEGMLLDKCSYFAMQGGDGACLGCGEKTAMHLFASTVTALMQKRVEAFILQLDELSEALQAQLEEALTLHVADPNRLSEILADLQGDDLTLGNLSDRLQGDQGQLDQEALGELAQLINELKDLKELYQSGPTGRGRAHMGQINSTGCSSVWGSTYPFNPYPFPWVNHLFQDAPSIALGVFEGHMSKMAEAFKLVRRSEIALKQREQEDLTYFNWRSFSPEELLLCPPVVAVGGDGAMYDIGFQNLSRLMMTGMPIKVVILDTQSYSNTGGQACTSGFPGQVSDMAVFGKKKHGKSEIRKEIGLIGMGHRTSFILQASLANPGQMIEGFIEGLRYPGPALFNLYAPCMPEHGIGDDRATEQSKLALETRSYPIFSYSPQRGSSLADCLDLSGNPDPDLDWATYEYEGEELRLTFADFAITEGRFAKHFTPFEGDGLPLADYLALDTEDREGHSPVILMKDKQGDKQPYKVSEEIVQASDDRQHFWRMLREMAGQNAVEVDEEAMRSHIQTEMAQSLALNLLQLTKED